jgi:hypothetical protein
MAMLEAMHEDIATFRFQEGLATTLQLRVDARVSASQFLR